MTQKPIITKDTSPEVIEKDIEMTRKEMRDTVDEIGERFSMQHWKAVTRDMFREKAERASSRGKALAGRARDKALNFGRAARDKSVNARGQVPRFLKNNPWAARVLAFEAGAWFVIAAKSLATRKRGITRESDGARYAKAKIMSIEEVEQAAKTPEGGRAVKRAA